MIPFVIVVVESSLLIKEADLCLCVRAAVRVGACGP